MKKGDKTIKVYSDLLKQKVTLVISEELSNENKTHNSEFVRRKVDKVNKYFRENPDWEKDFVLLRPGML